jgi:MFS family permease
MSAEPSVRSAGDAMPLAAIAGIIATVSVFAVSQGLTYPLLSFLLQQQGVSPGMIGLSAAMTPLGFMVSAPLIPWMSRRAGPGRLAVGCAAGAAAVLFLIAWTRDPVAWFPLRFILGFLANPLYVVSETWLITIVPPARRGRFMGIYTSIVSAGFAIGPLTLATVGIEGWPPFLVGIGSFVVCGAVLVAVLPRLPVFENEAGHGSVVGFAVHAPLLVLAVFCTAAFEQSLMALIAVYGEAYGSSETRISSLLTVFIAGNIALQVPLGLLTERIGTTRALVLCASLAVLGSALLPFIFATPAVWPMAFLWGAVAFGIYTIALIGLGERFSGTLLITGNAAFALTWGFGGIAGPPLTGAAMGAVGVQGLPVVLGLMCLVLVASASLRGAPRAAGAQ